MLLLPTVSSTTVELAEGDASAAEGEGRVAEEAEGEAVVEEGTEAVAKRLLYAYLSSVQVSIL